MRERWSNRWIAGYKMALLKSEVQWQGCEAALLRLASACHILLIYGFRVISEDRFDVCIEARSGSELT